MPGLFPQLGAGVGYRPHYHQEFRSSAPAGVRWIEVITEGYLALDSFPRARALRNLDLLRRDLPVALHGVSLSIASADPLDWRYLRRLRELVDRVEPAIVSDHLCWTGVDGVNLHDLLPVGYTRETLEHVVPRILRVQDALGRRILIENVSSYVQFADDEIPEPEFLAELARRADCGLLLDVNNVYVSSRNHGFDARAYLRALPPERVGQIHVAGHSDDGGLVIDTHDAPVRPEVWALLREAVALTGPVSAMVERDAKFPPWEELAAEVRMLSTILFPQEARAHEPAGRAAAPL
jgi:uncharacterized protein